jgi:type I restriction-modification system DNA methylase subunit
MDFSLDLPNVIVPVIGSLAVFSYLAVATWSENRRKEREAYYRCDALRKIAETQGGAAAALEHALQYLREEERNAQKRRQEGLKLGGLI